MVEEKTPQEHAESIAEAVQNKGYCIFYSDLFYEKVAYIKDLRYRKYIPDGVPVYLSADLKEIFAEDKPKLKPGELKLIHEAVKAGGVVTSYQKTIWGEV